MKKHWVVAVVFALFAFVVAGCGDDESGDGGNGGGSPSEGNGSGGDDGDDDEPREPDADPDPYIESNELADQPRLALEIVASGLRAPTNITSAPDDDRLFVLERLHGAIQIIQDGEVLPEPFLDIRARLEENGTGEEHGIGERGLLALAFHPEYATNGRFFVYYADLSGLSELVEYRVSDDPNKADPDSKVVLRQFGPSREHYGGTLLFAPDGMLWFSIGDGSQRNIAGDVTHPRGAIHRLDVSTPGEAVPAPDNPYLTTDGAVPELWAKGLRNPWRMTIDEESGLLYVGDVGEADVEEINVQPIDAAGLDYGWPIVEGTRCLRPDCDASGTVEPTVEHLRDEGVCAVIGGVVYRGSAIPELQGAYLYSDYCAGFLRSFRFDDGAAVEELEWFDDVARISSIGTDSAGEVYLVDQPTGTVRRLILAE